MNTIFLTALALSMDACAASIALSSKYRSYPRLFLAALSFAVFQTIMPALGYLLGVPFEGWIASVDHWIAFLILGGLGVNMIVNFKKEEERKVERTLNARLILVLAFATSIDAFAVGIGFHALKWDLFSSALIIGLVTLALSVLGVFLGRSLNQNLSAVTEKIGGVILVFLGFKILFEHLFS